MVFKKPYALLIKHFKLIHIFITILMVYSIFKMTRIINFFNEYVSSGWKSINESEIAGFIPPILFIAIILVIILSVIIFLLMRFKKKPRIYYLLTPIVYILTFVVLIITNSTLKNAQYDVISPITSRAIRDILMIFTALQFIFIIPSILRAIGFDVKKFNFKKDIADLEITELDNEEVEVGIEIEKYKFTRKINRRIRNVKYVFLEHKFIWMIALIFAIVIPTSLILINNTFINKTYKQNSIIQLDKYSINIRNSYITTKDVKNNIIDDKNKYIIIDSIIINNVEKNTFNTDNLSLEINGKIYTLYTKKYSNFIDYGIGYNEDTILKTATQNKYIFAFRIPSNENIKNVYLKYFNGVKYNKNTVKDEYKRIKLTPIDNSNKNINSSLNNELTFNNNKINIKSYEFNNQYTYTYDFCVEKDNCTESKGIINTTTGNSKTIIKLDINYKFDENEPNLKFKNNGEFFSKFATIKYMKNNKYYIQKNVYNLTPININKNEIYLEATNDIQNSKYISINFKYKGVNYSYVLKDEK